MALNMIVDSSKLNNNFSLIADAIRFKTGHSSSLSFPYGFINAITAIPNCVTFKNYDNSNLDMQYVFDGNDAENPIGRIPVPYRPSEEGEYYDFIGWSGNYSSVFSSIDIVAAYSHYIRARFYYGSSLLQSSYYNEGDSPSYLYSVPSKPGTSEVSYSFRKWYPEIEPLYHTEDYYATYYASINNSPATEFITASSTFTSYSNSSLSIVTEFLFAGLPNLTYVSLPQCTSVSNYGFTKCSSLESIYLPLCTNVNDNAFNNCVNLININLPEISSVGTSAFANCTSLSSISLQCGYAYAYAFDGCVSLENVNLPRCSYLRSYAFRNCNSLINVNLPCLIETSNSVFYNCSSLESICLPVCSYLGECAFENCISLTNVVLPSCTSISYGTFRGCSSLKYVEVPRCSIIGEYAFQSCGNLTLSIGTYLSVVCSIYSNTFDYTHIESVYVPVSLLSSYLSNYRWSKYASKIFGI